MVFVAGVKPKHCIIINCAHATCRQMLEKCHSNARILWIVQSAKKDLRIWTCVYVFIRMWKGKNTPVRQSDWFDTLLLTLWLAAFQMFSHNDLVNGSVCHSNYACQMFSEMHTMNIKTKAPQCLFFFHRVVWIGSQGRWSHFSCVAVWPELLFPFCRMDTKTDARYLIPDWVYMSPTCASV